MKIVNSTNSTPPSAESALAACKKYLEAQGFVVDLDQGLEGWGLTRDDTVPGKKRLESICIDINPDEFGEFGVWVHASFEGSQDELDTDPVPLTLEAVKDLVNLLDKDRKRHVKEAAKREAKEAAGKFTGPKTPEYWEARLTMRWSHGSEKSRRVLCQEIAAWCRAAKESRIHVRE